MRQPTDALRSLSKYMSIALGPEWEVRFAGDEGVFARPFCRVGLVPGARYTAQSTTVRTITQPFSIVCHPIEKHDPDEAALEAARVAGLLNDAFTVGAHSASYGKPRGGVVVGSQMLSSRRGHPLRIPMWDYTGVPLDSPVPENQRDTRDFMRVIPPVSIDVLRDPNDDLLYAIPVAASMSWVLSAAVLSEAMPVQEVNVEREERP